MNYNRDLQVGIGPFLPRFSGLQTSTGLFIPTTLSLFSVDVTKTEIDFNNRNPKCASCCTFLWVRIAIYVNSGLWTKSKIEKKNFFICNLLYSQEWTKFSTNIFLLPNQNLWCLGEGKDFITIMSIQVRCILECLASCVFHLKVLSHWLHLNGSSPLWTTMCLCKEQDRALA